jgi:hypothetical protein
MIKYLKFCIHFCIQVHEEFNELTVRTSPQLVKLENPKERYWQDHIGVTDFGQIFYIG